MSPDVLFYVAAALAALMVGLSKGGLPMIGLLAVPILSLVISPVVAAGLLLPIYVVSDWFGVWMYRHSFDRRNLWILIPATTLGIAIGWATASITSERLVTFAVGAIGVSYGLNALIKRSTPAEPRPADIPRGMFWGTLAGFTSFVSHAGGPPYQMYVLPQKLDKQTYAGTTTVLFTIVNALKLFPYWTLGQLSVSNLRIAAWILPVAVAGTFIGYQGVKILPEKLFFRIVEGALFAVSVKLLYDAIS
jgi:uncharacterized membrane protein YfcA